MAYPHAEHVHLAWSPTRILTQLEGNADGLLKRPAASVCGLPLHEALGISEESALQLDARARAGDTLAFAATDRKDARTHWRLQLALVGDTVYATVVDLTALLKGAPPVQISPLSSSLSHEIRNPLSSVKMAVQTLQRNAANSDKDKRRLAIAHREIRTMERMLSLLSEYGRDTPPRMEAMQLRALLQQAQESIALELSERQVTLSFDEAAPTPAILTDSGRLRPVLAQLILNTAAGLEAGGTVPIKLERTERGGAALSLRDTTSELLPEERETLFEPFGSRLARGAGLSLAAIHQVMRAQRGQVSAQASAEGGTLFTLSFPPA